MTAGGIAELLDVLSRAGVLAISILVIIAFLTERIVPRGRLDELRNELEAERTAHTETLKRIDEDLRRLDGSVDALSDRVRGP